jgi:23S rRNA G2069 N7-methylase RlmK/C1962 C5-methylase RlmI
LYRELQQINSGRHDLSKGDGFELGDSNSGIGVDPDDRGDPGSSHAVQTEGIAAILRHHFQVSLRKRLALGLPRSGMTDTFRWVNGEGDSLSGLAVDLLGLDDVDENSDDTASSIPTTDVASAVNDEETRQQRETKNATKPGNAGPVVVVMSSAGWCQIHQEIIVSALQLGLSPIAGNSVRVVWRTTSSRLAQDGYSDEENRDNGNLGNTKSPEVLQRWGSNGTVGSVEGPVSEGASASPPQNHVFSSLATTPVVVRENGVLYKVFPWSDGQKTSVYCDQRDNRIMLAELCRNKRVLDLCCYHGGFTLNAVLNGGATHCTAVDSSQDAIRALEANLVLNRLDKNKVEPVCSDITEFLQQSCHGRPDRQYDVVVLDPPKLAPTSSGLEKARRKYHGLNRDAIKVIDPGKGGLLLTCTCSAAMSQRDGGRYFLDMVSGAALSAGRCVTLLRVTGAAACHVQCPVAYPAGAYLTAALFYVHAA